MSDIFSTNLTLATAQSSFHSTIKAKKKTKGKGLFTLNRVDSEEESNEGENQQLLDKLTSLSREFEKTQQYQTLLEYKKNVKRYIKNNIHTDLKLDQQKGILNSQTLSQKKYTVIHVIDSKIDKMLALFLQQQKTVEILALLGEIQGLLVNITG